MAQVLPSHAVKFRFPPGLKWFMAVSSVGSFGFAAFAIVWWLTDPNAALSLVLLCAISFGAFGTLALSSFDRLRASIAVASEGIRYLPQRGEPTFIAWCDVANVKVDDVLQRLVLVDVSGIRCVKLEYQLEGFGRLRELVLQHTSESARSYSAGATVFHRTRINKAIFCLLMMALLLVAWFCFQQHQVGAAIFFMAFLVPLLLLFLRDPSSVFITRDAIVIKYPGWRQAIRFADVTQIELADLVNRGNVWAGVTIYRQKGRRIKLFRFREGSLALRDALQSAWHASDVAEQTHK